MSKLEVHRIQHTHNSESTCITLGPNYIPECKGLTSEKDMHIISPFTIQAGNDLLHIYDNGDMALGKVGQTYTYKVHDLGFVKQLDGQAITGSVFSDWSNDYREVPKLKVMVACLDVIRHHDAIIPTHTIVLRKDTEILSAPKPNDLNEPVIINWPTPNHQILFRHCPLRSID
jgi:hypothetical protein